MASALLRYRERGEHGRAIALIYFWKHMLQKKMATGALFRLRVQRKCVRPLRPFDSFCDETVFGTGFVVQLPDGARYIMTAHHVVSNHTRVTATSHDLDDGVSRVLRVVGVQPHIDVALLEPDDAATKALVRRTDVAFVGVRGASSRLRSKDAVTALGFANADRHVHTTSGTVSGRLYWPENRIQTDTTINGGNSGGPVVDKSGALVGLVTSGMDDMQSTNFFVGYDEVLVAVERMLARRAEAGGKGKVGRELGLHINAALTPVDASALPGHNRGGALVVAAFDAIGLRAGDVITAVAVGEAMRPLDAHMMIDAPEVWSEHRLDFRVILDRLVGQRKRSARGVRWPARVLRDGVEVDVQIGVGPDRTRSRPLYPDCEPLRYVVFGGLVVQMLSEDHLFAAEAENRYVGHFGRAEDRLFSFPVVTHVLPDSPFELQDAVRVRDRRLAAVRFGAVAKGDEMAEMTVATLDDLMRAVRRITPDADVVLHFYGGARAGAHAKDLHTYTLASKGDRTLRDRTLHRRLL